MRVLVCGGRNYNDRSFLFEKLDLFQYVVGPIDYLMQGGATGADLFAYQWALANSIPCQTYRAKWNEYRKAAGFIRNQQMLDEGKPDIVVAFPGGRGTKDMIDRANKAGIRVIEYMNDKD